MLKVLLADGAHEMVEVTLVFNIDKTIVKYSQTFVIEEPIVIKKNIFETAYY